MGCADPEQQGGRDAVLSDNPDSLEDRARGWSAAGVAGANPTTGTDSTRRLCGTGRRRISADSGLSSASSGKESHGNEDAKSVGWDGRCAAPAGISVGDRSDALETQLYGPLSSRPGACEHDSETWGSNGSHDAPQSGASRQPADETSQVVPTSPPATLCV